MKTTLLFFFIFYIYISYSQEIKTEFVSKTPLQADTFIGVDELNHIYYIKNNVLFKKGDQGTINYSNVSLGKITSVNIQNPFKIVVFYKDFNSIILLDSNLNELTNRIDLTRETHFNNVQFVSISSENNLWIYADDTKLYLYDYKNNAVKVETQPINFYQNGFLPKLIKSTYKNVWLLAQDGVIQFNEYGNYIHFIDIENILYLFPLRNGFVYFSNNAFFHWKNKKSVPITLNHINAINNIDINNYSIHIFDGKDIYQYRLKY